MGKIAIWIFVAIAVMLLLRMISAHKRRADDDASDRGGKSGKRSREDAEHRADAGELVMSCAVCGIHIPASEAAFARGKVFCGTEHRDLDDARRNET